MAATIDRCRPYCGRFVLCAERPPTELVAAVGSLGEDILTGTNEDLQQFVAEDFRPDEVRKDSFLGDF